MCSGLAEWAVVALLIAEVVVFLGMAILIFKEVLEKW